MRKIIYLVAAMLMLPSCSKDKKVFWDILPVGVEITVKDKDGKNLLDPAHGQNILNAEVTAEFMGESYTLKQMETKAIMPTWYGFSIYNGKIYFGEFDGAERFDDEDLIIDWWGASKDTVTIRNIVHDTDSCWVDRAYYLNGEKVKYQFEIIK